ncbi:MAG: DEAD/DEAH box helicase [Gemmatimonas sp.]
MTNDDAISHAWREFDVRNVRARIAHAMISQGPTARIEPMLGEITLHPHQSDAVGRLLATLGEFGGALLADDVGLGKTFVAIAVAARYHRAHVIAPANLLPMWRLAITRSRLTSLSLHSLHACSLAPPDVPRPDRSIRDLVVIDEAHHLRNAATKRYRTIAAAVAGHDVLLLSATPVHNRPRDLRAQFGLFTGARSDLLEPALLSRLIVRRTTASVGSRTSDRSSRTRSTPAAAGGIPTVVNHAPLHFAHDPCLLTGILALPAPLPARDGAVAGALIRLGLLRAWTSSDSALTSMLTRRILRSSALHDALRDGRHPTRSELRSWLVGEHEVQLAFPTLLVNADLGSSDSASLIQVINAHVSALVALRRRHRQLAGNDAARTHYLREVLAKHPGVPVVAFSQFADTVRSLHRALSDIAGVGMLTATDARIASGRIARDEMLARFAPLAQGVPPPPPHGAVRLLISTDMLAEGVNLQDAGVVIHLDLPWTDALRHQRVGRVARMGSKHSAVHVYTLHPPPGVEHALRQLERLRDKSLHGQRLIGDGSSPGNSAAGDASAIHAILHSWASQSFDVRIEGPNVAVAMADVVHARALVLVESDHVLRLLACTMEPRFIELQAVVCESVRAVRALLEIIDTMPLGQVGADKATISGGMMMLVERAVAEWSATQAARDEAGAGPDVLAPVQHRAAERIGAIIARASAIRRGVLAEIADGALSVVHGARGEAMQRELGEWLSAYEGEHSASWLTSWSSWPLLRQARERWVHANGEASGSSGQVRAVRYTLRAVILLRPAGVD